MRISVLLLFSAVVFCLAQDPGPLSPPYTCTTTICQPGVAKQPNVVASRSPQGAPGKRGAPGASGIKGDKGDPCVCDVADEETITDLRRKVAKLMEMREEHREKINTLEDISRYPLDCGEYKNIQRMLGKDLNHLGNVQIFPLKPQSDLTPVTANCTDGWIVFQRRMDGSVDFFRDWESYAVGFGNASGEFWMGLRTLHKLTSANQYKLRIELRNWDDGTRYAEYSTFRVGDEDCGFVLTVSGYSGTARDGMTYHNGREFSTHDRDSTSSGCPVSHSGAWWYRGCYSANLNGKYFQSSNGPGGKGVSWQPWLGDNYSLKHVEMKMKPV